MKTIILILACILCSCAGRNEPSEVVVYRRIVPDSLKDVVAGRLIELMNAAQTSQRYEDEDWDDFVKMAKYQIESIYAVPTVGIYSDKDYGYIEDKFVPYGLCSKEQKELINKYLFEKRKLWD